MTKNKLTPEEKQMPKVRLPFWTALLCCVPLLAAVSFYLFLYFHNTATGVGLPSGLHLMPVIYVVPTLIGLFFRRNHLIRFSSEGFVYRDMLRRIHRYTYDDARLIYATKSSGFIKTEDRTLQFSIKSKHGKLLYALLEKNNVRSGHIDREESVTTPIVATTLGLFFLWVYIMCKMDGEIRFATNAILCVALITIIIGCHSFYENFLTSNQPRTRGHYIIDTDGDPVELFWFWNPLFFFGVGFWIFGALTNVIYWIYYILAAGCFLYLIGYALCIRYLYLCPEKIVAKICKDHLLSEDLKAKMPEKYSSYIQNSLPQEKNEKIPTSKEEPNYISFGSFALAFLGILVFQFLFFNTYLHDSRFEQTQTTEVTFTEGYYQDDSSRFGADYLAYDNEGRRFTFRGFDMYGDETTFTEELNGKTCVVLYARANMGDDITVLQCSENDGTVILSEENSRQRHKDIALFRIKINLIAVALLILCGFLTGYFWKPQSKQKKTSKLDPIRKKIYRGNIRKSQYLGGMMIMTAFLCIGTPAIAVFDPETVDTEKMLTRTETIVSYQYDDDFIRSVIDNEYLDLYNQNNDLFYVAEFDTFAEHREQFFHEMQKGTAFTFQGEYIDGDFRIYSIRDENGIDYYTIEDANTVVKEDKQKSLWFFTLLSVLFIIGDVIYLMILRRLEKMPLWILKKVLKEDEPFPELRQKIPADHKAERKFVDQYFLKAATKKRRRKKQ